VNGFGALRWRQVGYCGPDQLHDGRGIFPAGIADDPGSVVGQVKFPDFFVQKLDGSFEALGLEGRRFIAHGGAACADISCE